MGTRPSTPDLFSHSSATQPAAENSPAASSKITPSSRRILPADLPNAIRHLDNQELDRLLAAVLAEQKRRGRKIPGSGGSLRRRQVETSSSSLTQGQLNAVRAAFKAGITPSRIARQFRIPQSDVRKALAIDR